MSKSSGAGGGRLVASGMSLFYFDTMDEDRRTSDVMIMGFNGLLTGGALLLSATVGRSQGELLYFS